MDNITLRSPPAGMVAMKGMAMGGMNMNSGMTARLVLGWEHGPLSTSALLQMVSHQDRIALNQGNVVGKS